MSGWHSECGINGGFMWLYDDFVGTGEAAQYASAINNAVGGTGFTLSGPSNVFLNQNSTANASITITDLAGFDGKVTLHVSGLPKGVQAAIGGQGNNPAITFTASPSARTGFASLVVKGISGKIKQTLTVTLAVSAALGSTGTGTQVDLIPEFNLYGIYQDGSTYSTGGLDGLGYSYSANLLTTSRVLNGELFNLGPANELDAVGCNGQTVTLPSGQFSSLVLLATGVSGNQTSQTLTIKYTDGTSSHFVRNFSDWYTPQKFSNESEAVAMAYRNYEDGTEDQRTFNLYAYKLVLNPAKVVESVGLPNDPNVVVVAATLLP
jgi:hypothetical protein